MNTVKTYGKKKSILLFTGLVILILSNLILAEDSKRIFIWQDAGKKRKIVLLPNIVAEFPFANSQRKISARTYLKTNDAEASILYRNGSIIIWKTKTSFVNKIVAQQSLNTGTFKTKESSSLSLFSPVFKDASGRMRALPGKLILYFEKNFPEKKIINLLNRKSLVLIKLLSAYSNSWLIQSDAGISVLTLAADLQKEDGVRYAIPNWWIEHSKK